MRIFSDADGGCVTDAGCVQMLREMSANVPEILVSPALSVPDGSGCGGAAHELNRKTVRAAQKRNRAIVFFIIFLKLLHTQS